MNEELPVGALIERNGVRLRHLGGGRFEPVGEPLEKRFGPDEEMATSGMAAALARAQAGRA